MQTSMDAASQPGQHWFDGLRALAPSDRQNLSAGAQFVSTNQLPEGDMPRQLSYSADGTEVLVVQRDTDSVTFFDASTLLATHTLTVGDYPLDIVVTPDNRYAFVPNALSHNVSAIDITSHSVVATIPISGTQPYLVRASADSQSLLVGVINDAQNSAISVIDVATLSEVRSIPTVAQGVFGFFFTPEPGISGEILTQFAYSSATGTVVLPDRFGNRIALYDTSSGAELLLPAPALATSVDISPDGLLAVVGCEGATRRLCTLDLASATLSNSFSTNNDLSDQVVRVTHDKTHALIAVLNNLQFVNLSTGLTTATIATGTVGDIELSFDGLYAFVSNFNARVIHIPSQSLVKTLTYAACADADTSPVSYQAAALNNRFREDVHFYDIQGSAGTFLGVALAGEPAEGDAPRTLALSADGRTLVVAHNTSNNAAIVDVASASVLDYLPTGLRSLGVAIAADGSTAVVANAGNDTVSVLDLTLQQTVATLSVPSVPAEVVISADGQWAYVTAVGGSDRLYFIQLNGAASQVVGSLLTGQMGSIGYTYGVLSGISLAPDGATLALCISFDDQLLLVDTATRTEIKRLGTGDFPIRAVFSPDSSRIYVTNSFGDSITAISNAGTGSVVLGTVAGIEFPLAANVTSDGQHTIVGSFDFNQPRLAIVDNQNLNLVASLVLPSPPRSQVVNGSELYVSCAEGQVVRIALAGAASQLIETRNLAGSPADMVYSASLGLALCAQPGPLDGIDWIAIGELGSKYCTATSNSTGSPADLTASGSRSSSAANLRLEAAPVPNQNGVFFHGASQAQLPFGNGFLCTSDNIVRGAVVLAVGNLAGYSYDNSDNKHSFGAYSGVTRNFQYWYRDPMGGGAFFNTSNALAIELLP